MYPRGRIDVSWADWRALHRARPHVASSLQYAAKGSWLESSVFAATLRTLWDAYLSELRLPAGSEVLCTAVSIPDMFQIARGHGLVPVPVDIDPLTLEPDLEQMRAAITPQTRLILVTHLLGARVDMEPLMALAQSAQIPVVEDCAQCFDGKYRGHPSADAALFSFGPIKTWTCFGGGVGFFKKSRMAAAIAKRMASYPEDAADARTRLLRRFALLKFVTDHPSAFGTMVRGYRAVGCSYDAMINRSVLCEAGERFEDTLRKRPDPRLLAGLIARVPNFDAHRLKERRDAGEALAKRFPEDILVLGRRARHRTWWLFAVSTHAPQPLVDALRIAGFDATASASRLVALEAPEGFEAPWRALRAFSDVVYIPAYASMGEAARDELARALCLAELGRGALALPPADVRSAEGHESTS